MGERLRELRRARGLSQPQLAAAAGVGLDALRKWERGKRTPLLDAAEKLADALECSIDDLVGRKTPRRRKGGAS